MSEPAVTGQDGREPAMNVSAIIQLAPLSRPERPGVTWAGDLQLFTDQLTAYLSRNLEGFADPRGGDVFLAVITTRGGETANREYRSGHYVMDDPGGDTDR